PPPPLFLSKLTTPSAMKRRLVGSEMWRRDSIRADRLVGGTGIAGAAASSTAGNAVATPLAIAQADPSLAEVAAAAAPLIAASVITTAILTPVLTSWVAKKQARQASLEKNA
ncbi:2-keto-3-deoxygluconate permease, partial [Salmonella enterica]|uniref:2-keto-3-deoxygluconate permease n=1 Tax=Salmonella enterica TaxID=28901 RepID=UPI001F0F75A3